jgi:hypothetical protein
VATNDFVTLPTLAGNGASVGVDVSGMGATKTIVLGGATGGAYEPVVAIQVSMDNVNWASLCSFQGKTQKTINVACHYLRTFLSGFVNGAAPSVGVGGDDTGVGFTTLNVTAGNGASVAVGTSTTNPFKTVQVSGVFSGVLDIQISEDGGVTFATVMTFTATGIQSAVFAADHMRVNRKGYASTTPGTPTVVVSDGVLAGSGSGGAAGSQELRYTAVGGEMSFVMSWATPRADTKFNAHASGVGLMYSQTFDCPVAGYTTTSVTVNCSAPLVEGDQVAVSIVEITN